MESQMGANMNKLFKRDFTMVVIGQIISLFGNAILRFALPLCLLRETDSASLFGAVTACAFIPMVIFWQFRCTPKRFLRFLKRNPP